MCILFTFVSVCLYQFLSQLWDKSLPAKILFSLFKMDNILLLARLWEILAEPYPGCSWQPKLVCCIDWGTPNGCSYWGHSPQVAQWGKLVIWAKHQATPEQGHSVLPYCRDSICSYWWPRDHPCGCKAGWILCTTVVEPTQLFRVECHSLIISKMEGISSWCRRHHSGALFWKSWQAVGCPQASSCQPIRHNLLVPRVDATFFIIGIYSHCHVDIFQLWIRYPAKICSLMPP